MTRECADLGSSKSNISDLIIDAKLEEEHQLCGTTHCPACGHKLHPKPDWVGLPAGVKFDPTDQELIEHLEAKVQGKESKSHPLIDEFIPTIQGDDGICYTHPENLPGVTRDGLSRHFFHRPSKAYTTGTRKRRKIQTECDDIQGGGETRWHKTGKTRPVMVNGKQKGCKKILVLYTNFGKNRKPEKTNWVMHQYHLGIHEEEKEGELVASKIFYQTQPRQCNWSERANNASSSTQGTSGGSGGGGRGSEHLIRRDGTGGNGGGSGNSSSREMIAPRDELSVAVGAAMSSYGSLDNIQQLKGDQFSYLRYRKSFDELTNMVSAAHPPEEEKGNHTIKVRRSETSIAREGIAAVTSEEEHNREMAYHLTANDHQPIANTTSSFNISRPSLPISTIISPPPLHHSSVNILDDDSSFHVSTLLLQNQNFQQQQQQQHHHHKLGRRAVSVSASASGLEELIMGCTSTDDDVKQESSSHPNPQEMEWLKYSTSFWPDPDNPDHHV